MRSAILGALSASIFIVVSACSAGDTWVGKCVGVTDGDTIRVMRSGKAEKVRLYGVDCPEKNQDFGTKARQFTAKLVFKKSVTVEPVDKDRYGRTVAWVSVDGVSLNRELLRAGLAWWYRHHAGKHKDLQLLESEARAAKIGIWSSSSPVPPWEFRRDQTR
jgi:micrococcal nuclease